MNKSFLKGLGILATAVVAGGVCVVGYKINEHRQYEQRVAYAETAVVSEKNKLATIETKIADLYTDKKQHVFVKNKVTTNEVTKIQTDLEAIRVTAEDFDIKDKALPPEIQELAEKKEGLTKELTLVSDKVRMQGRVNKLFTKEVKDWQKVDDTLAVQENVEEKTIKEIKERVSSFKEDAWRKVIDEYVKSADEQVKTATALQKKFDELLKEGAVVTYEDYMGVLADIEKIRNEKLKEKFMKLADQVSMVVGLVQESTESIEEPEVTESSEEVIEETVESESYEEPIYEEPVYEQQWQPAPPVTNGGVDTNIGGSSTGSDSAGTIIEDNSAETNDTVPPVDSNNSAGQTPEVTPEPEAGEQASVE